MGKRNKNFPSEPEYGMGGVPQGIYPLDPPVSESPVYGVPLQEPYPQGMMPRVGYPQATLLPADGSGNTPPVPSKRVVKEQKKRAGSIAGKIHHMEIRRMFFGYFWLNLILIVTTCLAYVHQQASDAGFSLRKIRDVELSGNSVRTLALTITTKAGELTIVPGGLLWLFINILVVLGCFEALSLLRVILFDRFPIRRRLKPLREMAETAQSLSNAQWNEEKLQNLTYAISHIDAESPSDHVRTNDRELTGMEQAVNDLIDRMRQAAREQTRFVSDASHELRTPIAVIKGYADMLDRWGKDDKEILEEAIAAIRSESDHMNTLVEQLLFLARGDAGRQKLTLQKMSLTAIMKEVHEESEMIDKNHTYEFVPGAGEVICYGDPAMLKQSIRILVDNAAKYTTVGDTITLRVGVNQELRPFYSVQDNGVGMSSHDVEHIFERFYRSDTARNSKTGGTGLGLAIAKWIVNRHHGTIMVQSRPEIGTRFTIILHAQENTFNDAVVIGA